MLQIKHLTITHRKDNRTILKDFSFVLNPGDRAVLVGEEGDGKSTLLKLIYDPALVAGYAEAEGEVVKTGLRLGYLPQELPESGKNRTVLEFCSESPSFSRLSPPELSAAAVPLGLAPALFYSDRKVGTLSGGEKVKLQLARIRMEQPDVLLLDEPSNDLDLETLEWLETFLNTCGLPVLYVSHDETLIENTANVVVHLEQVRRKTLPRWTVARMPYRQYVEERLSGFARQEKEARRERGEYEKQQEKFRRIESRVEHEQASVSRADPHGGKMLKKKMKAVKSMGRRFERGRAAMTELPDTEDAIAVGFGESARVPNGKVVLDFSLGRLAAGGRVLARGIRLHVEGPEKICIVGKNGAGKSTLLKRIAEDLLARDDIRAACMPQDYGDALDPARTAVETLSRTGTKDEATKIRTFLGSMKYTADEMEHSVAALSGGQKAKLLFLKMILDGSNVLVLDEPTRNFSPLSNPVVRRVLRSFGGAVVSVSHDRKYIAEVCGKVYRLTASGLAPVPRP
ncbi:MAG: ATP-binding cassette domain-containing protein [Oscillospiraceae bacterium]|jgi:ATPase subunit of ABC transporter with duplicated ATPase domains|nr:ATP-binding cassette domain-containing protein [Oscillospiraceae bacterium]MCI1990306.1 ATP-binding cassette domain-containing protein [Oscillospiraceae bacterium]MCI2034585.1 ATP-binding cassette domain-containing protein [Oscillospiraceae bacterium]